MRELGSELGSELMRTGSAVTGTLPRSPHAMLRDIMRFRCGTLNENWYIAARSRDVSGRAPFASTVLEEPLVLFRGKRGEAVALIDRCLHRNAALSAGDVFDGCIGCPYHGWTYDASGTCVVVPSEGTEATHAPSQENGKRQLQRFPVLEQDGFVWVYMGTPDRAGERDPFAFPHAAESEWASYTMVTRFDGDATDLVENFMDVPHTAFVHAGWFRKRATARPAQATVERTPDSVHVTYFQPNDAIGFSSKLLNPDNKPMTHTDQFFMPNVTRVDYSWGDQRGFVITSQITPITADTAVVYTAITFRFGIFTRLARWLLPPYTRAVINQDVRIMAIQSGNIRRFGGRQFHGTEADVIHRSIESLREYAAAGETGAPPEPMTARIGFWM
ncbi:MAG: Rieske 2Fe-2S domain-containing protein [Gemmatimonadaceae bacterium]